MAGRPKKVIQDEAGKPAESINGIEVIESVDELESPGVSVEAVEVPEIKKATVVNPCVGCKYAGRTQVCKSCEEYKG